MNTFKQLTIASILLVVLSCSQEELLNEPTIDSTSSINTISGFNGPTPLNNLIRNPGFEERKPTTNCPDGPWNSLTPNLGFPRYWDFGVKSTLNFFGTPDYLQACANINSGYNPLNHIDGSETPHSGNSMGGFIASSRFGDFGEYYIQELATPLIMGKEHEVEFFVSLAEDSEYFTNGLGAYFTDDLNELILPHFPGTYGHFTPQVASFFYINKTSGWSKISGSFTPNKNGIKYIVIGDFSPNPDNLILNPGGDSRNEQCYYYLDDVSVTETPGQCPSHDFVIQQTYASPTEGTSVCVFGDVKYRLVGIGCWSNDLAYSTEIKSIQWTSNMPLINQSSTSSSIEIHAVQSGTYWFKAEVEFKNGFKISHQVNKTFILCDDIGPCTHCL